MEILGAAIILLISTVFFLFGLLRKPKKQLTGLVVPGPKNLPIIGSIHHLLGRRRLPHHSLRDLSAVYGPIMRLKLGEINTIVISSAEAAKEIMQTHDIIFASRPITPTIDALFYGGKGVVFSSYSDYWRQMRRLCVTELLNSKRISSFQAVREQEVSQLMQSITAAPTGFVINLSRELANLGTNIMVMSVIGGRCEDQKVFLSALGELVELNTGFSMVDLFPSIPHFISRIVGIRAKLERCRLKLDRILEKIVQEHHEKRAKNSIKEEDLTDSLLRIQNDGGLQFPLSNDDIKAIINDILVAGSETTWTTLEWSISELVCNPIIMKKVQKEVREAFGFGMTKIIGDEEFLSGRLSYMQLVIKETLRLHTPLPLLLPRVNQERCEVMGYEIPARTTLMVNAWAIGRDPKYWEDPEVFRPERFEEKHIDMRGANFEMLPFGAGRRVCPGIQFGMATIELALAHLLYYFDWEYPAKNGELLDMTEALGVSTRRKSPLCLLATPCIPIFDSEDKLST
ncbi:cytochrome P450 CYP71D312-like [Dendrobium catenatum]|uniref:Cytochrome P450 71D7 n=1 Tax=Dendrobium catenatum TaxID=906689 RepID=A0A2I0X9E1_9ASPA|nr:cytochrome P450 CYP71D312-like [Dendrobium catenatum]PKU84500.1 Cytochrome P450 71D7 [Dendrobium catenatum]